MLLSYLIYQVALKFEHRSSKGCPYGPPSEWQVYKYDHIINLYLSSCDYSILQEQTGNSLVTSQHS